MNTSITELFDSIEDFVTRSKEQVRLGTFFDLKDFDSTILALCDAVKALPKNEGAEMLPRLEQLMADVSDLGVILKEEQQKIAYDMRNTQTLRKANVAYSATENIGGGPSQPMKKEEE